MREKETPQELPLTEACFRYRIPYPVLYRQMLAGAVQGRRVGGRWMVRTADVERLAEERAAPAPVAQPA